MALRVFVTIGAMLCAFAAHGRGFQDDRQQAVAAWDRAVAAKGGRDRLAAIRSFAIQEKGARIRTVPGVAGGKLDQVVCELPGGWWEFLDYRPGEMGYSVSVVDAATGMGWTSRNGAAATPFQRPDTFTGFRMRLLQLVYFLETSALKPKPIKTSRVALGGKTVDRVTVDLDGSPADVYLDETSHLPTRIETVRTSTLKPPPHVPPSGTQQKFFYDVEGYHDVGGVQVPTTAIRGEDRFDVAIEINPAYDPSVFTRPPAPGSSIDSWRKRTDGR